jgi:hypothetical protein
MARACHVSPSGDIGIDAGRQMLRKRHGVASSGHPQRHQHRRVMTTPCRAALRPAQALG